MTIPSAAPGAAMAYLSERDLLLGQAIARIGPLEQPRTADVFSSLLESIASQQISGKAAVSIWRRFTALVGEVAPVAVAAHTVEELRGCGFSQRKAEYILGIAAAAQGGALDLEELQALPDDEVIKRLSALRGVGVWTAEMLLIFSLGRADVLSWGDLGIRRGMQRLYGYAELTQTLFEERRKVYSPYGSTASLYLWRIAGDDGWNQAQSCDG